jgi:hypothetical protein
VNRVTRLPARIVGEVPPNTSGASWAPSPGLGNWPGQQGKEIANRGKK